jgi:hypothetical protein
MDYLKEIAAQFGISIWLLIVILVWSLAWKLLAFWKSARKKHIIWFLVFAFVNTVGILEILYIYVFSDMNKRVEKIPLPRKSTRKKRRR